MPLGKVIFIRGGIAVKAHARTVRADGSKHAVFFRKRAVASPKKRRFHYQLLVGRVKIIGCYHDELLAVAHGAFYLKRYVAVAYMQTCIIRAKAAYVGTHLRFAPYERQAQDIAV